MEDALLGDDAPDQESYQQDDWHRLPGDTVEMMHRGGEPKTSRAREHSPDCATQSANHLEKHNDRAFKIECCPAEAIESCQQTTSTRRRGEWPPVDFTK